MGSAATTLMMRLRALDPEWVDRVVGACMLVVGEAGVATHPALTSRPRMAIWVAIVSTAVAVRRRWLLQCVALAVGVAAALVLVYGSIGLDQTPAAIALVGSASSVLVFYGGGAFLLGWRSWLGLGLGVSLATIGAATSSHQTLANVVWDDAIIGVLPWFIGRMVRDRTDRARSARASAELLDAQHEYHARAAALGERARLAREIHDVIAHSVSVMVIQTAGARTVMDREPARASEALLSVERAGREALAEMRRLLGVLGDSGHLRELAPQPGIEDLDELVARVGAAGLPASITVVGDPIAVPPGLSLCAYRVVQEALTNAIKHAGAARAEVSVRWRPDALELVVIDDGDATDTKVDLPGGHGLLGMRERAALHGGSVDAGPGPVGGFVVRARIPLASRSVIA